MASKLPKLGESVDQIPPPGLKEPALLTPDLTLLASSNGRQYVAVV